MQAILWLLGIGVIGLVANRSARRRERICAVVRPVDADGVIPGAAEIRIDGGPSAVLLLHGAGDTPQSVRYLAEFLGAHGYTVHAPLLPGHGHTLREFARNGFDKWIASASDTYTALCATHDWVAIVGQSMGGALGLRLAADHADAPALVLLAPYVAMPRTLTLAARVAWLWGLLQPYPSSADERSIRDPVERSRSVSYPYFSATALRGLARAVREARAALPRVRVPTLMLQSPDDNRIAASAATDAFDRLGARDRKLVWIAGAGHVLSVDYGREHVFSLVQQWLDEHGGAPAQTDGHSAAQVSRSLGPRDSRPSP